MVLKDCKFFADINGRQVEMDFDGFRAYLLEDGVMATLAPEITGKRGKKAGLILTAKKEEPAKTVTTKAEAPTVKAQSPAENVVTVTAEPTDAHIIANSVKIQKVDAQGFTKRQREYLVEKAKEVYKEAQEASESTKFVIKVPGDGQFTVKTPTEANSLHRRLTGDNVPGVDAKDTKVKREVLNPNKKTGLVETVAIGKAGDMKTPAFRWALQATAPSPATSKPLPSSLFGGVNKKGEFENKGSGVYPFEMHGSSETLENVMSGGEYITDAKVLVLRSASTPEALKKVKTDSSRTRSPNIEDVKSAWEKAVNDATVPAEIAGVFQSETVWGVALIEAPKGIIPLDANRVKTVFDLVKPDGVMIAPDDLGKPVIFTKNGKPVGTIMPLLGQSGILKKDELANALDEMKRQSGSPSTLPVSAESLRRLMPSLSKDRAETLIKLLKAMGLPFDRIKLAKGEAGPSAGLKQAETSASVREAAKKWAGVKEIKPAVNSRLSSLTSELEQLRGNIERSLYKKSIDELIAIDPMMQMTFGGYRDKYPVQQHSRLKTTMVEYYSNLFNQPESDFAYDYYSEQWGVPKADLIRQADINTLIYFKDDSAIDDSAFKEEAEERLGISKESILERGPETFKTGQPVLVEVYHGTGAAGIQGNRFNASLAGKATGAESAKRGYFFAGSKSTAERYRSTSAFALDPINYTSDTKGILYKFFVKMKNPFVYDMKGNLYREDTYANIMDKAKAAGHDGVIFTNTYDGGALDNIFTLFHSHENQIKSANPNTYDDQGKLIPKSERFQAETPDIRYQKGQKPKQPTAITGMTPQEAVEYFKKAKLVRPELAQEILTKDVPEHLQPVADFIFRQRQKFLDGKMTVRDVAKAYIITVSSIQAGAIGIDAIKASTGQTFPEYATMRGKKGDIQIRPEDAVSAWLLTPDGKKALDSLEQTGKVDEKLWQPLIDLRQAYGNNTLKTWAFSPKSKGVNLYKIEEMARLINQTGGNPRKLEAAVQRLVGIKDAKAGFIKHLLGFGDTPTVDAREINFWLTGSADISSLKTKGAEVARAAKDAGGKVRQYVVKRIGNQIKDLAERYDMDVNVGAHIVHHWLWDATSNEVTTHAVMMDAMELAQQAYHATRGLFAPEPGFPNGRFRLDKVDTGLGAQSFGHGIYIAESRAGVVNYVEMLEEEAPGSVVYELDVPDGIVSKLATYGKPLTPSQFAALKNQVQSTLGEKALQAIPGRYKTDAGDLIERIQDVIKTEDAARQTSEIFSKAGIPGVKVEVSKDYGENKSFYVIWNQAALDRIALLKANEKPLQSALETTQEEQEAPPLGSIEFVDDLNAVISLFEKANVSTIVHEGFHFYRRHMMNEENGFTPDELKRFGEWAGAKNGVWTVAAEEKAARGFEKYLRDGSAPTSELKKLFEKIAKWMREVYQTLQGSEIDIDIPDNIRRVFDRIFTLEAERMKASKTGTTKASVPSSPATKNILYQKEGGTPKEGQALFQKKGEGTSPNAGDTASEAFRRKQAEQRQKAALDAMNRLRNAAKEPKTATPPPAAEPSRPAAPKPATEPKASRTAEGTSRRPRQERTIEEEVAAAIDRARKGKPNPNDLPLDEQLRRSIRAFADRFARRMVEAEKTGTYNPDVTLPDGATADRQKQFEKKLREYSEALRAGNESLRDSVRQELEALLPERPKSQKTVAERIQQAIDRAEKAANKKAKSLTPEEEMDRSVRTFVDRFAKRMTQAKKAKTYTSDVVLPNGDVFDRQEFFQQAVQDYMDAYKAQNQGAVSMAKSRIMLAMEQVPPDIGFGIHSLRSPLSYSNVIGSYEGVMGELGAEISTAFKRFHQEVAFKRKTLGEALTDLRRLMRTEYFPAMQERGYYGMQSVITAHIDYIQAMAKFGQDYNQLKASVSIFKNPKAYLDFAKKGNTIPGRPQSNVWPMAAALMKTFVYTTKLKYNPKSALMNYTQVALSAGPYFSPVELAKVIASSHRPAVRNRVIEGMKLVDVAVRTTGGREAELEKEQKSWWRVGDIFQGTSEQTRVIGYLLGEIMADRAAEGKFPPSKPQREEIIRDWIEKIEFDNSPWNVAPLFRENGLKGALLQFKPFVQKNMERLLADMARNPRYYIPYESENFAGKAIEKVLPPQLRKYAKLLGYQVGIGGIGSMLTAVPGLKPLAGYLIYSGLVAAFKAMGDDDEVAEKAAEVVYYGAPALVGTDLSNSVGYLEVPQGKTIYEQLVNQFLGPTVSTVANTYTQVKELQEERAKPEPLGRPGEKDEKVTRRAWDVAKAITPVARTAETALTMARGKQPEMYLDRPIPLTRGEKAGRLLAFNPLRQAKFFEEKGAADWQKRLAGKVPENLEIKRKTGESDENYSRRQAKYEKWKATYTPRMLQSSDFRRLKPEDKDAVLDNLKRNMVEETNSAVPDTDKFDADVIIGRRRKRRERIEDRD